MYMDRTGPPGPLRGPNVSPPTLVRGWRTNERGFRPAIPGMTALPPSRDLSIHSKAWDRSSTTPKLEVPRALVWFGGGSSNDGVTQVDVTETVHGLVGANTPDRVESCRGCALRRQSAPEVWTAQLRRPGRLRSTTKCGKTWCWAVRLSADRVVGRLDSIDVPPRPSKTPGEVPTPIFGEFVARRVREITSLNMRPGCGTREKPLSACNGFPSAQPPCPSCVVGPRKVFPRWEKTTPSPQSIRNALEVGVQPPRPASAPSPMVHTHCARKRASTSRGAGRVPRSSPSNSTWIRFAVRGAAPRIRPTSRLENLLFPVLFCLSSSAEREKEPV